MKKLISTLFIVLTALVFALPAATAAPQSGSTGAKSQTPLVVAESKAKKAKPAAAKPATKAKKAKTGAKSKKAAKTNKAKKVKSDKQKTKQA